MGYDSRWVGTAKPPVEFVTRSFAVQRLKMKAPCWQVFWQVYFFSGVVAPAKMMSLNVQLPWGGDPISNIWKRLHNNGQCGSPHRPWFAKPVYYSSFYPSQFEDQIIDHPNRADEYCTSWWNDSGNPNFWLFHCQVDQWVTKNGRCTWGGEILEQQKIPHITNTISGRVRKRGSRSVRSTKIDDYTYAWLCLDEWDPVVICLLGWCKPKSWCWFIFVDRSAFVAYRNAS